MALSGLPRELILDIADQLDDAGKNALACTNGQMYDLLNEYLYRWDVNRSHSRSLTWAIENGEETIAANTLQRAIDAAGQYHDSNTIPESIHFALQGAAKEGHVHLVERILKVDGINPNFGTCLQSAPLILAAHGVHGGHSAVVELLLATNNIDPNVRDLRSNYTDMTPLIYACKFKKESIVRQLLARSDVDLNAVGYCYGVWMTPLTAACSGFFHYTNISMLLIANDGIDVNLHNPRQQSRWKQGCERTGKILIDRINSLIRTISPNTPLLEDDSDGFVYPPYYW
jgi:ankyrin repeat protein